MSFENKINKSTKTFQKSKEELETVLGEIQEKININEHKVNLLILENQELDRLKERTEETVKGLKQLLGE